MERRFLDRTDGGRQLARVFDGLVDPATAVVVALPRGGVPVGYEIARSLQIPMDLLLVHKLGIPGQDGLAMGAVTSGGRIVLQDDIVGPLGISESAVDAVARHEMAELERRERLYRAGRPPLSLSGKTVLLVDDGVTTGTTMKAAIEAVRLANPDWIIAAIPAARRQALNDLRGMVDDIVCVIVPELFHALGFWYRDFDDVSDAEIGRLLERANASMRQTSTRF